MAWLGLDLGEKRIGVAVADEVMRIATPVTTLTVRGKKDLLEQLQSLLEEYDADKVVVGLPKTLQNEIGPAAQRVNALVAWLREQIKREWILWDERLTTAEVEKLMVHSNVRRAKRQDVRDQLAAQRILQSYLDASV